MLAILFIVFFILLLVPLVHTVDALRQSVDEIIVDIKPGETQTFKWILASDKKEEITEVELSAEDEGLEFLSFEKSLDIDPLQIVYVTITVTIPNDYPGGIELKPKLYAVTAGVPVEEFMIEIAMEKTVNLNIAPNDDPTLWVDWDAMKKAQMEESLYTEIETSNEEDKSLTEDQGGCLIATATYGSELAPQVQMLREIRDNMVLQTQSGDAFMTGFNQLYYSFSPTIADLQRQNPAFKETVKIAITPLITSLSILNYVEINSEAKVLGYGISLIILNLGMYFVLPAIVVHRVRKFVNPENS